MSNQSRIPFTLGDCR